MVKTKRPIPKNQTRLPLRRLPLCCFLICVSGNYLDGQQPFSWEQVRDKFKQTNPTLLSDQVNIDESRAEEITAFLRPNPDLSFGLDQFTVFRTPNTPYRPLAGVLESGTISYLYERQHKRDLRLESAQKATKIAISTHADLERNLLFTLRNAFVQALQAKAFFEIARQNLEYWNKEIDINTARFKAGDLAKVDLSRIVLQRAQYQADYVNAQVNLRTAKIALLMLLNDRTPVEKFDITGPYDFQEHLAVLEDFRQMAMDARPDLKAAVEAVDKAKTDNTLAIANGTSDPTWGFDIGRNPPLPSYIGFSVSFPLRIFDKNQGEKLRTKLDIDRADKSRMAAEAQVLSDVDTAHATVASTIELLKPYKQEYIPQASEVREIVTFAYQRGGASLIDFLDAQKEYRDIQLNYVNLIGSYLTAASQLNLAVGREVIQ
jgi:cobalt-zinc-cadmium efflux system outer membrane protein